MASSCSSVDSRTLHTDYRRASVFTEDERRQARRRRCTNATLLCGAQTVSRRFVNTSPWGKRPWPCAGFESRKSNCFRLLLAFPLSYPLPTPLTPRPPSSLSSFQEQSVKKHGILQHSLQLWRREEGKKLYHPVGLIEGISDALGVRHSSSSFLHWRLYKQVSNAPDLVWQTFSKEHLKRGWESDTPTCAFFFFLLFGRRQNQVSTYSSAFQSLLSLPLSFSPFFFPFYSDRSPVVPSITQEMVVNQEKRHRRKRQNT